MEHKLFSNISPNEFQNLNFTKKDKSFAPNIYIFSQHFNRISKWFLVLFMSESTLTGRVEVLKSLIDLATHFYELKNYNGVMETASAWSNSAAFRLRKTWAELPPKYVAKYKAITDLTSIAKNSSALRSALAAAKPPVVPYTGLYQSDLTFLEEGNSTTVQDGAFINWNKCKMQAKILLEIRTRQIVPYMLTPIPWMQDFFANLHVDETDDYFWGRSLEYEPKVSAPPEIMASQTASTTEFTSTAISTLLTSSLSSPLTQSSDQAASSSSSSTAVLDDPNQSNLNDTFKFLLRGQATFLRIPYPANCFECGISGARLKRHIYRHLRTNSLAPQSLVDENREQNKVTLVLFSGSYRYGAKFIDEQNYSLIYLHSEKAFLAGFKSLRSVEVIYAEESVAAKSAWFKADADSPLFSLVVAINNAFSNKNEFMMVKVPERGERRWLNVNLTLNQQEFGPRDKIIVVFTKMFAARMLTSKAKKDITSNPDNKSGFLTKHNVRLYTRNMKTTLNARQRFDDSMVSSDDPKVLGSPPLQIQQAPSSSSMSSTLSSERNWFLVTDGLLYYFKDQSATEPRRVWALEYCGIALEYLHKTPVLTIRIPSDYPFFQDRSTVVYLSCRNESELRSWYDVLQKRSKRGYNIALFGVSMDMVNTRPGTETFFPIQIRRCMEQLMARGLEIENLFTGTPPQATVDKYREIIESGGYPNASAQPADMIALASIVQSYYAELPEPLIMYEMCSSAFKGVELHTEGSRLAVMALIAALPSAAMFGLLYIVALIRAWASVSGSGPAAAKILSQFIAAGNSMDEKEVDANSIIIAEELLKYAGFVHIPKEKCVFKQQPRTPISGKEATMPITVFSQPELDFLSRMVTSSVPVVNTGLDGPSLPEAEGADVVILGKEDDDGNNDGNDGKSSGDGDDDDIVIVKSRKDGSDEKGGYRDESGENDLFWPFYSLRKKSTARFRWDANSSKDGSDYSSMSGIVLNKSHIEIMKEMDKNMKKISGKKKSLVEQAQPPEYAPLVNASLDSFLITKRNPREITLYVHSPPASLSPPPICAQKLSESSMTLPSSSSKTTRKFRGLI